MAQARAVLTTWRDSAYNGTRTAPESNLELRRSGQVFTLPRMATLNIQLLGEFSLTYNDAPLMTVNTKRLQSLLAYLVLNRRAPQARQRIAFLFWPDSNEQQALTNLRNLLHTLNKALPNAELYLSNDTQTLQWKSESPYLLDAQEFENAALAVNSTASLERAARLYQGELLPGLYDDWIVRERERLDTLYVETLAHLIKTLSTNGSNDRALEYARRLVQHDPLLEDTYRDLMWLYARRGDRAGVRRVYNECVAVLRRELDVEPSRETQRAYEQALKFEPAVQVATSGLAAPDDADLLAEEEEARASLLPRVLRGQMETATYILALGVAAITLVLLLPLVQGQLILAIVVVGIAIVLFAGLLLLLVYRPHVERERQKLRDDIRLKLDTCASQIKELRGLGRMVPKPNIRETVGRICERADKILAKLRADEEVTLSTATQFAHVLTETGSFLRQYLDLLGGGGIAGHPDNLKATVEHIEDTLLPAVRQALDEFAVNLDRGDLMALEAAIRSLEATLKHEGIH